MTSAPYEWLEPYLGFEFEVRPVGRWRKFASYATAAVDLPDLFTPGDDVRLRAMIPGRKVDVALSPAVIEEHFEEVPG